MSMLRHCFSILSPNVDVATLINQRSDIEVDVATLKLCSGAISRCRDIGYRMSQHSSSSVAT